MLRVVIVDDQFIISEGIQYLIERDSEISVVGLASNGEEAFKLCEQLQPDVVLMDIVMPNYNGVIGTKMIKEKFPNIKVIILTTFKDEQNVSAALKNGADGYVLKDIDSDKLIMVIKGIYQGFNIIHSDAFETVTKNTDDNNEIVRINGQECGLELSKRDLEIIKLVVYGKSNKEIAAKLDLCDGSVRNMVSSLLAKLNLKDRTQLAVFAVKNKII